MKQVSSQADHARPRDGDSNPCGRPALADVDLVIQLEEDVVCGGDTSSPRGRVEDLTGKPVFPSARGRDAEELSGTIFYRELAQLSHQISKRGHAHLVDAPTAAAGEEKATDGQRAREREKNEGERAERDVHRSLGEEDQNGSL